MKKRSCLLLIVLLCLSGLTGLFHCCAEGSLNDVFKSAFSGNGKLQLVPFIPDCVLPLVPEDEMEDVLHSGISSLLDISADGEKILYMGRASQNGESEDSEKLTYQIYMIQDGQSIPIQLNSARGNGEPHDRLERTIYYSRDLPGLEGLSWSADGRYVTFSNLRRILSSAKMVSLNVPVIDTADREVWLADSYDDRDLFQENSGIVYLTRMSRSGAYVYYLMSRRTNDERIWSFCRCAPEGGQPETLVEWKRGEDQLFEFYSTSNMFEMPDESWLMVAAGGKASRWTDCNVLVRFAPSGDRWNATVISTMIPQLISPMRVDYSAASDSGVMAVVNENFNQIKSVFGQDRDQYYLMQLVCKRINLVRFSGETMTSDVWYIRRTGEGADDVEMVSGTEYLQYLQGIAFGLSPQIPADISPMDVFKQPDPIIYNVCLSPDGRYALLYVFFDEGEKAYRLYLLDMETMALRNVELPEGVGGKNLIAATAFNRYRAGILWKENGTIVIQTGNNSDAFFRLTVQ